MGHLDQTRLAHSLQPKPKVHEEHALYLKEFPGLADQVQLGRIPNFSARCSNKGRLLTVGLANSLPLIAPHVGNLTQDSFLLKTMQDCKTTRPHPSLEMLLNQRGIIRQQRKDGRRLLPLAGSASDHMA